MGCRSDGTCGERSKKGIARTCIVWIIHGVKNRKILIRLFYKTDGIPNGLSAALKKIENGVFEMGLEIRKYTEKDLPEIIRIWNEVVEEGIAFPQEELLNMETGAEFFSAQSFTGVAEEEGRVLLWHGSCIRNRLSF